MNKRIAGFGFVSLAAFLYAIKYLTAAIYFSNVQSWGREYFSHSLHYVGPGLSVWAGLSLIIGVYYLVSAEWSEKKRQKSGSDFLEAESLPRQKEQNNCNITDYQNMSSQTIVNFSMRADL